jgi:hypothetical protein
LVDFETAKRRDHNARSFRRERVQFGEETVDVGRVVEAVRIDADGSPRIGPDIDAARSQALDELKPPLMIEDHDAAAQLSTEGSRDREPALGKCLEAPIRQLLDTLRDARYTNVEQQLDAGIRRRETRQVREAYLEPARAGMEWREVEHRPLLPRHREARMPDPTDARRVDELVAGVDKSDARRAQEPAWRFDSQRGKARDPARGVPGRGAHG